MGVVPCPTDFTDVHRFFLRSPDVSSHADLAFPSAADFQFADFADFLPFYLFKFPHGFGFPFGRRFSIHGSHGFFTFYFFTFNRCIKC